MSMQRSIRRNILRNQMRAQRTNTQKVNISVWPRKAGKTHPVIAKEIAKMEKKEKKLKGAIDV